MSLRPPVTGLLALLLFQGVPLRGQAAIVEIEVASVVFTGNEAFSDYSLSRAIITRQTECVAVVLSPLCWVGIDFAHDVSFYSRTILGRDRGLLLGLYISEGFREVRVDTVTTMGQDGRIRVEFLIDEGRPTLIGSLQFNGGVGEGVIDPLLDLPIREGDRLSGRVLEATRAAILEKLRDVGYAHAEVLREVFIPRNDPFTAEVGFDVYPDRRFRFGQIIIDDSGTLEEAVVRRQIPIQEGDLYNPNKIIDAQRSLYALPIINYASVDTIGGLVQDTLIDVRVRVIEGDLRKVRAGGGWSTAECFSTEASWANRNLFGGARRLQVRARVSNIAVEALQSSVCPQAGTGEFAALNWLVSAEFDQPWFFSPRASLNLSIFAERQSLQDVFVREAIGVTAGITRRMGRAGTLTLSYSPQLSKLEAAEIFFCTSVLVCDPQQAAVLQGFNWLSPVELAFSQDRRDQVLNPRSGYFWVASIGHASPLTGSDFRYERLGAEIAAYTTIRSRVLAARVRGGWLGEGEFRGLGGNAGTVDIVPPQVRLFAGGANSVRGFPQNRLGPRVLTVPVESLLGDRGSLSAVCAPEEIVSLVCDPSPLSDRSFDVRPTGGSLLLEASIEVRMSLGRPNFEGALFLDIGQLWEAADDFSVSDLEFAPGFGVRYFTPIGPVRIDLGYRFRGEEALRVVTSQVRPFDPSLDSPSDRLTGPGGTVIPWVRTDDLALLNPLVAFGRRDLWSLNRLQLHFSIGQAY